MLTKDYLETVHRNIAIDMLMLMLAADGLHRQ